MIVERQQQPANDNGRCDDRERIASTTAVPRKAFLNHYELRFRKVVKHKPLEETR